MLSHIGATAGSSESSGMSDVIIAGVVPPGGARGLHGVAITYRVHLVVSEGVAICTTVITIYTVITCIHAGMVIRCNYWLPNLTLA